MTTYFERASDNSLAPPPLGVAVEREAVEGLFGRGMEADHSGEAELEAMRLKSVIVPTRLPAGPLKPMGAASLRQTQSGIRACCGPHGRRHRRRGASCRLDPGGGVTARPQAGERDLAPRTFCNDGPPGLRRARPCLSSRSGACECSRLGSRAGALSRACQGEPLRVPRYPAMGVHATHGSALRRRRGGAQIRYRRLP